MLNLGFSCCKLSITVFCRNQKSENVGNLSFKKELIVSFQIMNNQATDFTISVTYFTCRSSMFSCYMIAILQKRH